MRMRFARMLEHQKYGFQKYLDDAMAERNETIVDGNVSRHFRRLYR